MKRIMFTFVVVVLTLSLSSVMCLASRQYFDIGGGYSFAVDGPHTGVDTGKYHVHVKYKNSEIGSEGVDGSMSHKDHMNKVPKKEKEKIKNHPEYKKRPEKARKIEKSNRRNKF